MQFKTYPDTENFFRWSVLPDDFIPDTGLNGATVSNTALGGLNGARTLVFDLGDGGMIPPTNIAWLAIPLALYYDYYRLGGMLAGAAPQNLLINLLLTGNGITVTPGVDDTAKFTLSAWIRNIGDDLGTVPPGTTPYNSDLTINPATLANQYLLQKTIMGPMYLRNTPADKSDGLLIIRIERLVAGNTYLEAVRLYSATVDMGIVR